jgi:hypothetical protein
LETFGGSCRWGSSPVSLQYEAAGRRS